MLSPNQTFEDLRAIKVLVVPIGNNSLFDIHFQVVSKLRTVPFYELNKPTAVASKTQPLHFFNWNNGSIVFDYLRYDRVLNGPGDLDNFQSSKRVLMVMGLINYPELGGSIDKIEEELDYYSRRHPYIVLRRIFVFNFMFDIVNGNIHSPPKGLANDPNSLVIFPPDGKCEGGSMVDVHLTEVMSHATVKIIVSLEQQLELCEESRIKNTPPPNIPLSTHYDELDDSFYQIKDSSSSHLVSTSQLKRLFRKRSQGRLRKWMADLCLQICSPVDALDYYIAAVSDLKSDHDYLWLASAYDGYAATTLALLQYRYNLDEVLGTRDVRLSSAYLNSGQSSAATNSATNSAPNSAAKDNGINQSTSNYTIFSSRTADGFNSEDAERVIAIAEDRANSAILIYSRSIVLCTLEVESILRLARMHELINYTQEKEEKVLMYVLKAASVPGLNSQQQIECLLEGALICHRLGMTRKYAMFLFIASLMSADSGNYAVAHVLIHYACKEFGIQTDTVGLTPKQLTTQSEGYSVRVKADPLQEMQATVFASSGDSMESGPHSGSELSMVKTEFIRKTTFIRNSSSFIYNSTGVGDEELSSSVSVYKRNSSWLPLRSLLYATGAIMAREHEDTSSSSRFLSALLILMGETETQHQYSKTVWTKYLERIKSDKAFLLRDVSDVYEGKRNCSGGGNTPDSPLIPYKLDSTNRTDHSVSSSMKSESDTRSNNTIKKSMEPPKSIRRHQEDTTVDNVFGIASIQDEDILGGIDFNGFTSQRYAIVPRLPKAFSLLVGGLRKLSIDDSMSDSSGRSSTTNEDQKAIVSLLMNQPTLDLPSTVEKSLSERIKRSIQELSGSLAHSSGSNSSNSLQYLEYSKIFLDSISRQLTDNKINKGLQNEALVSFSGITRRLPPNTPVKLPIRVHWIRAVRPLRSGQMVNEVNERILVRARNVAKEAMHSFDSTFTTPTKNALYYDPFAAHRASIRSKSNCSYYYFSGESFKLRLYLENPLALPIEIDRIVPIVTGATAEIRPVGIHLAANSMHYLDIVVIPLEPGELVITGVKLFFQNAAQLLRVEADGSIINRRTELGGYLEYPRPARERLDLNGANKVMDEDVINSNTLSIVNAFPRISHSIATLTEEESIASIRNNFKDSVTLVHNNEPFKSMRLFHSEVAPLRLLISATSSSMSKANLSVDPPVYDFRLIAREFIISECGDEQELQSYTLITFSQALRPIESERIDESELFLQRRRCCHVPLSGNSKQFLHCAKIGDLEWTPTLLDQRCYSLQIPLTLQACASVIRVELEVELVGLGDREALQRAVVVATASTESLVAFDRNTLASLTTLQIFSKKMFCHFGLNNQIMSSSPSKKEDLSVCDVRLIKKQIATNTYEVNRANEAIRRTLKRSNLLENSCPVNNEFCSAARSFVDLESCRVLSDHILVQCQIPNGTSHWVFVGNSLQSAVDACVLCFCATRGLPFHTMNGDEIPPSTIQAWWKGLERGCYDVDKEELLSLAEPLPTNCKLPTILGALPSETLSTLLLRFSQTKKVKNILPTWWALLDGRSIGEKELKTLQQGNNYNMLYDRIQVGELTLSPQLSAEYKELQSADSRFLSLAKLVETIPYRIQVTLNQKNRYAHQDSTDMGIQIGSSSPISSDSCPASQNERICTFEDDNFTRIVRLGEAVSVDISVNAFGTFPYLQDDERKLEICVVIVNSEVPTVIPEHIAAYARTRGEVDDCTLPYSAREYIVTGKLHCILDMTGKDPITSSDLHGILSSDVQAQETNITEQKSNINADCVNGDQIFAAHHYFELTFLQPGAFSLYTIVRTLGCGDKWSTNPVPTQICATNG